ncbi:MAG: ketopantoate reductase family protein, partial [Armatimonadetes bacterium]|nr:ketopantoate reductase family protein [Armatimonadota bacterium]
MRYLIYGAGGIGAPLGAYLHKAGESAVLIARGEHLRAIQEQGLRLISGDGEETIRVPAVGHPGELQPTSQDCVALTMKAQDTEMALRDLLSAGFDADAVPIFSVQNCIANEPIAARYFPRVYGVMIVIPGSYLEPGVVYNPIRGNHGYMDVGAYPRGADDTAARFVEAVRRAGYGANLHENVMASKGSKFLGNLGNALEAITDGRGDSGPYMEQVRAEARACLDAAGLPYESADLYQARVRANRGTNVEMGGARKRGSSWQSLQRQQGTIETDFLNGEVVLLGRINGVPTPFNRVLQRIAGRMARNRELPGL